MNVGGNRKLKGATIGLMVAVALFYDGLQILFSWLGLGWLIIPIAYAHFWLWFKMKGLKFFTLNRAPSLAGGVFLEAVTGGIFTSITWNVWRNAWDYREKKDEQNSGII